VLPIDRLDRVQKMFNRQIYAKALMLLLVLLLSSCVTRQPLPEKPEIKKGNYTYAISHLRWLIAEEMRKEKITGLSVSLVIDDKVLWQDGFGYADRKNKLPVNTSTLFRAGSISKLINAIAMMQLVEQGRINLDDDISRTLPELKLKYHPAEVNTPPKLTLLSLLTHQSGLPSDLIRGMWATHPQNFRNVVSFLNKSHLAYPSESRFHYSNIGYDLLAMVIEQAANRPYEDHMSLLLRSLGMGNSSFSSSAHQPRTARGYYKGKQKIELSLRDVPAAGLTTNATDLANLIRFFTRQASNEKRGILTSPSIHAIVDDYSSQNSLNTGRKIGLGLFHYENIFHSSVSVLGHGGSTVNHRSVVKFAPNHGLGVAILTNTRNAGPAAHRIANKALHLLYEGKFGKPAPKKNIYWPQPTGDDMLDPLQLVGSYASPAGMAKVYQAKNRLYVKIAGRKLRLYQRQAGGFYYLQYKLFGLFPIKIGYLGNTGLSLQKINGLNVLVGHNTYGNKFLIGQRIEPKPIPNAWQARVGRYKVLTPLEVIDLPSGGIKVKDGFLIAHAKTGRGENLEVALLAVNDKEAIIAGLGRGLGETVYVVEEFGHEQLEFSNIRFEKIDK